MQENQNAVRKAIFASEGGYTVDKGGPTFRGITLTTLRKYRRDYTLTSDDLRKLTEDQAWEIYVQNYLAPIWFDRLPSGLDYAMADFSVNSGPSRAIRCLQDILLVPQDGLMGPQTFDAVNSAMVVGTINTLMTDRLNWMQTLSNWPQAGRGWTNRISSVRKEAVSLASGATAKAQPSAPKQKEDEMAKQPNVPMQMPPVVASGILSSIVDYAPLVFKGVSKAPTIISEGTDMVNKLKKLDIPGAWVDFTQILSALDLSTDDIANALHVARTNPPPADAPIG